MSKHAIEYQHKDYVKFLNKWELIDSVCESDEVADYIIPLNEDDLSEENAARNKQFKRRAVFVGVAGYTSNGLLGLVYSKDPEENLPTGLEYLEKNADGTGVSVYQQSQQVTADLIRKGRCGLWVDFPKAQDVGGEIKMADLNSGKVFATIHKFDAKQIYNWRTIRIGSAVKLSVVMISMVKEKVADDGYTIEEYDVVLELRLEGVSEGKTGQYVYKVLEWVKGESGWMIENESIPTDGAGRPWDEIPFVFCGSESNTWGIDKPPLYDICKLNIAHLNNSASYEDSVFIVGQVQPWMSGLTTDMVRELRAAGMYVGSPQLLPVPSGEQFGFAQAQPNQISKEAMSDKVQMMIGLGAMFIQPGSAVKTATQSEGEQRVQHSILSLIAANTSEAYDRVIRWCGKFMNVNVPEGDVYKVSQDFVKPNADAQTYQAVIADFLQGSMPIADFFSWKKRHGFTAPDKTLEEFTEEINPADPLALDEDE